MLDDGWSLENTLITLEPVLDRTNFSAPKSVIEYLDKLNPQFSKWAKQKSIVLSQIKMLKLGVGRHWNIYMEYPPKNQEILLVFFRFVKSFVYNRIGSLLREGELSDCLAWTTAIKREMNEKVGQGRWVKYILLT